MIRKDKSKTPENIVTRFVKKLGRGINCYKKKRPRKIVKKPDRGRGRAERRETCYCAPSSSFKGRELKRNQETMEEEREKKN